MAKHLTDREKKKIIADYAECGNYSQVARKHKVSFDTVKRVVISDPETVKKAEQKKKSRIPLIFLSLWTRKKDDVCSIISLYLSELQNSDKLQRASIQSIATSLGIVIDKFTKDAQKQSDTSLFEAIAKAAGGFKVE
ncbi:MAG: helix-turn-helix domain-containing protein [[Clostridium] leptum]